MVVPQTKWTRFPLRDTKQSFESAIATLEERTGEEVRRFLLDLVQPYAGGKCAILLDLHNIDIEDKHRILIARREYTRIIGMTAVDEGGEVFVIDDWMIVPPHTATQPIKGHRNFQLTDYGTARIHVVFGEGTAFQGKPIVPMLNQLTELVSRVVDVFETIYTA